MDFLFLRKAFLFVMDRITRPPITSEFVKLFSQSSLLSLSSVPLSKLKGALQDNKYRLHNPGSADEDSYKSYIASTRVNHNLESSVLI